MSNLSNNSDNPENPSEKDWEEAQAILDEHTEKQYRDFMDEVEKNPERYRLSIEHGTSAKRWMDENIN